MRVLKFIVEKQDIRKDPQCDFSGIARGTRGYLKAQFRFSKEWDGSAKAAVFRCLGKEYAAPIVNGSCMVPDEVCGAPEFYLKVIGETEDIRIVTNRTAVRTSC